MPLERTTPAEIDPIMDLNQAATHYAEPRTERTERPGT